jgi:PAS domain S-box-containing protein
MLKPALPPDEAARLEALRAYEILDTAPGQEFDDITLLASHICGTPIAMISLVDENRQWFKSKVGTEESETSREVAFCAHGILQAEVFVVKDAILDARFADNPLVIGKAQVRFYAGAPLVNADGHALGMLCVNDRVPREITDEQKKALQALSRQVVAQLELKRSIKLLQQNIVERRRADAELAQERNLLGALMENSGDNIYFKDAESRFVRCSTGMAKLFGVEHISELIGRHDRDFFSSEHASATYEDEHEIIRTGVPLLAKIEKETWKSGGVTWALTSKMPFRNEAGEIVGTFGISKDITAMKVAEQELEKVHKQLLAEIAERKRSEQERHLMELQLRQSQKLEAIGQLAAGIAHEINTPTQYVGDNTRFFKESFESIAILLRDHKELLEAAQNDRLTPDLVARAKEVLMAADLDYLFEQVPTAINETIEGVDRISKIVRAMKEFSHPGGKEKTSADLNKAIESTVTVARGQWKYVADMKLNLDPELPRVPCFLGEFNQCVLNLLINAAHAIGDKLKEKPGGLGLITVGTRRDGAWVEISVRDTGTGIPESARPHIFEPFFTTKEVGKGTGQGLSMVYCNIVKKHGGQVAFETEAGVGTCFLLRLPISPGGAQ